MKKKILSLIFCITTFTFAVSCSFGIWGFGSDLEEPGNFEFEGVIYSMDSIPDVVVGMYCSYDSELPMGTFKCSSLNMESSDYVEFGYNLSDDLVNITSRRGEDKFYKGAHAGMTISELKKLYGEESKDNGDGYTWYFKEDGTKCDESTKSDYSITVKTSGGKVQEITLMNADSIWAYLN